MNWASLSHSATQELHGAFFTKLASALQPFEEGFKEALSHTAGSNTALHCFAFIILSSRDVPSFTTFSVLLK